MIRAEKIDFKELRWFTINLLIWSVQIKAAGLFGVLKLEIRYKAWCVLIIEIRALYPRRP